MEVLVEHMEKVNKYFLPVIFGIGILFILSYYKLRYGIQLIESDSASDIFYAYILSQENSLISKNWFFSTQLRLFDNELLFALLFKCFPEITWWQVEVLGTILMNGIMGCASVFLAYQLGFGCHSLWMFGLSLLPYGESQMYYTLMHGCGYYGYAITQVYIILGIYFAIINAKKKHNFNYILLILLFLTFSFIIGMQGIRLIENLYMPLILGSTIYCCVYRRNTEYANDSQKNYINCKIFWISALGTSMALGGYFVNKLFLSRKFTWGNIDDLIWKEFDLQAFAIMIRETLSNLGYTKEVNLFSLGSLSNIASIIIIIFITTIIIYNLRKKENYSFKILLILFFLCALGIHFFIYTFLIIEYKPRYMLPFFMILPHIMFSTILKAEKKGMPKKILLAGGIIGIICLNTGYQTHIFGNHGGIENPDKQREMVTFLLENDFRYGFSTFKYTNSSVQHSNGKLQICPLVSLNTFEKTKWLCTTEQIDLSWSEKTFLIISEEQLSSENVMSWNKADRIIWHDGEICVFEFNSVEELQKTFNG